MSKLNIWTLYKALIHLAVSFCLCDPALYVVEQFPIIKKMTYKHLFLELEQIVC